MKLNQKGENEMTLERFLASPLVKERIAQAIKLAVAAAATAAIGTIVVAGMNGLTTAAEASYKENDILSD
jgi:hypothetical protein